MLEPDISHLVIEDDEPVDSILAEHEHRLLVDPLYTSWNPGKPFVALANVGVFSSLREPPFVPDMLLSLDVELNADMSQKKHRSYFTWVFGKPPDLVVEVVSNDEGHEERKLEGYARLGIAYYIIFDPLHYLSSRTLRAYELHGRRYVDLLKPEWIVQLGLGACLWEGEYQGLEALYLRWCDDHGTPLPTGKELAQHERQRADEAQRRAEEAQQRADEAVRRAQELEARLRQAGLDP